MSEEQLLPELNDEFAKEIKREEQFKQARSEAEQIDICARKTEGWHNGGHSRGGRRRCAGWDRQRGKGTSWLCAHADQLSLTVFSCVRFSAAL